jgi:hypothetical protein
LIFFKKNQLAITKRNSLGGGGVAWAHGSALAVRYACHVQMPPPLGLSATSTFLSEQISNQPAVLFSQNKPAPSISHQMRVAR